MTVQASNRRRLARRTVKIVAAIIQVLLLARIIVLLFAPSPDDQLVRLLLNVTQPFADLAHGVLPVVMNDRISGSVFDLDAVYALIGVTVIEGVILWAIGRRPSRIETLPSLPSADALRPAQRDLVAAQAQQAQELRRRFEAGDLPGATPASAAAPIPSPAAGELIATEGPATPVAAVDVPTPPPTPPA